MLYKLIKMILAIPSMGEYSVITRIGKKLAFVFQGHEISGLLSQPKHVFEFADTVVGRTDSVPASTASG